MMPPTDTTLSDTGVSPESAALAAESLYDRGYYCSEAIVMTACAALGVNVPREALKMATGFGAGMGHAGATCGALSGAVMAVSMLLGRDDADAAYLPALSAAREVNNRFRRTFGSESCANLVAPFGGMSGDGRHKHCRSITGQCAAWVVEIASQG